MVVQGEMAEFPNFPIAKITVKFITIKSARGHSYKACELALQQLASQRFPLEKVTTHRFGSERCGPGHQVGRRPGRAGCDPRVAHAMEVSSPASHRRASCRCRRNHALYPASAFPPAANEDACRSSTIWPFGSEAS